MSAKKKPVGDHACFAMIDDMLAPKGFRLVGAIQLKGTPRRMFVETEALPVAPRRARMHLAANYCPFCGKDLDPEVGGPSRREPSKAAKKRAA